MPDDAPWIDPVVVPDDIRDLQADIEAYHRERRQAARRRRLGPLASVQAWRRLSTPLVLTLGALTLAALVTALLTLGSPRSAVRPPTAGPIASDPAGAVGQVDGLLPPIDLRTSTGASRPVRALRPALFALVPMHCGCATQLSGLAAQAAEVGVPLVVVAPQAVDAEVATLPGALHTDNVVPLWDAGGVLAATYHASGVTVLTVARDATVRAVDPDLPAGARLELQLFALVRPQLSMQVRAH